MTQITKEELENKYRAMSNKELCDELEISPPTLFRLLKDAGIKLKRDTPKVVIVD